MAAPAPAPTVGPGPAPTVGPAQPQYLSVLAQATAGNSMATIINTNALLKLTAAQKVSGAKAAPTVGGGGGNLDPALEGYQKLVDRVSKFGQVVSSVWQSATQSMLSFVSAANPSVFSTFGASVTAVGIQVGQMFVPAVELLSYTLQSVAAALSFMPNWMSTMVGSTAALAIGFVALSRTLKAVGWEANLTAKAIGWISAAWKAHPWGLVVGGIAALVTLAGGWSSAGRAADYATGGMVGGIGRVTAALLNWNMSARGDAMLRNFKLPFESRVTTFEQYGESLQMKALETNDADKQNQLNVLREMLARMDGQNRLLEQIANGGGTERALRGIFG